MYGGVDGIYDWDPVKRECYWLKLFEHILAPRPDSAFNFDGWTYDRLLVLALLSGHDYLPNIPGCALKTVYSLMARATLPPAFCLPPGPAHPRIPERPALWRTEGAIRLYATSVVCAKLPAPE